MIGVFGLSVSLLAPAAVRQRDEQRWTESGRRATLTSNSAPPNFRGSWDHDLRLEDGDGALSLHPGGVNVPRGRRDAIRGGERVVMIA